MSVFKKHTVALVNNYSFILSKTQGLCNYESISMSCDKSPNNIFASKGKEVLSVTDYADINEFLELMVCVQSESESKQYFPVVLQKQSKLVHE